MPEKDNQYFEIGYLDAKDLGAFAPLILSDLRKQMEKGESYLAIGLSMDNVAVGALCGKAVDPFTFDLQSLFVAPKYRDLGGGTLLMVTLLSLLPEEISNITADFVADDNDKRLLDSFLTDWGASRSEELAVQFRKMMIL